MALKIKKELPKPAIDPEVLDAEGADEDLGDPADAPIASQPDQVLVATQETFSWLSENRNFVFAAVAVLALGAAGTAIWLQGADGRRADASRPLVSALSNAQAAADGTMGFADGVAREEAVRTAAQTAVAAGGDSVALSNLLLARANLGLGDTAAATSAYGAAGALQGGPAAERWVVVFGQADAKAASGDLAGALQLLQGLTDDAVRAAVVLRTAELTDVWGTPADALTAWRAFTTGHSTHSAVERARNRIAQLEILLDVPAVAEQEG